jgi:shikimate kinase
VEAETLEGVVARPGIVLAPGGGAVERSESRILLRRLCRVVYLDVAPEILIGRLEDGDRPPLTGLPLDEEVRTLRARRDPLYRECAQQVLVVSDDEPASTTYSRLRDLLLAS